MTEYVLGRGVLSWDPIERISDRYGTVRLLEPETRSDIPLMTDGCLGATGTLLARVIAARKSEHVGDLFREIFPTTPSVGEELILGQGELARSQLVPYFVVGLFPFDGRDTDWLDPWKLFRAHSQTVDLIFRAWGAVNDTPRSIPPLPEPTGLRFRVVAIEPAPEA